MYEKEEAFVRRCEEVMNCVGKNHIAIYSTKIEGVLPFKFALKEVIVKNGMMEFILTDGVKFYVKDKNITRNIHNGKKIYSANKDEAYMGKKSILKRHAKVVEIKFSESNLDMTTWSYSTENIMEYICNGIVGFTLIDTAIQSVIAPKPDVDEEKLAAYIRKNYKIPTPYEFCKFLYKNRFTA